MRAAVPLVMASCTFKSIMTPAKSDLGYRDPIGIYKVLTCGTIVYACAWFVVAHCERRKYITKGEVNFIMGMDTQQVSFTTKSQSSCRYLIEI